MPGRSGLNYGCGGAYQFDDGGTYDEIGLDDITAMDIGGVVESDADVRQRLESMLQSLVDDERCDADFVPAPLWMSDGVRVRLEQLIPLNQRIEFYSKIKRFDKPSYVSKRGVVVPPAFQPDLPLHNANDLFAADTLVLLAKCLPPMDVLHALSRCKTSTEFAVVLARYADVDVRNNCTDDEVIEAYKNATRECTMRRGSFSVDIVKFGAVTSFLAHAQMSVLRAINSQAWEKKERTAVCKQLRLKLKNAGSAIASIQTAKEVKQSGSAFRVEINRARSYLLDGKSAEALAVLDNCLLQGVFPDCHTLVTRKRKARASVG